MTAPLPIFASAPDLVEQLVRRSRAPRTRARIRLGICCVSENIHWCARLNETRISRGREFSEMGCMFVFNTIYGCTVARRAKRGMLYLRTLCDTP